MSVWRPSGSPSKRTSGERPPFALVAPTVAVAVLAVLPLGYLLVRASEGGTGLVWETLTRTHTRELFWHSISLTVVVTLCATVMGVVLAFFTTRVALPFGRIWPVLVALPLAVPSYVAALCWTAKLPQLEGFVAASGLLTLYCYPYVYLPVMMALRSSDPALEDVSRSLGKGEWQTFLRVTLPQIRFAAVAGALLVALYVLSEFGAVSLLRFDTLTRGIYLSYHAGFDRTPAAILGSLLVAITLFVLTLEGWSRKRQVSAASSRPRRGHRVLSGRVLVGCALVLVCGTIAITLGLPAVALSDWIVNGNSQVSAADLVEYSRNSFLASAFGAVATILAALPVALLAARYTSRWASVERLSYLGHALPGIVVALALVFFAARYVPQVYQELPVLVMAYVVLFLPLAIGAIFASAKQSSPALEEVARSLGKRPMQVLSSITIPLTTPGVLTGAALVFLNGMKELPATLLLQPTGFDTLATRVWTETGAESYAAAAAPAALLIGVAAIPSFVLTMQSRLSTSSRRDGVESEHRAGDHDVSSVGGVSGEGGESGSELLMKG